MLAIVHLTTRLTSVFLCLFDSSDTLPQGEQLNRYLDAYFRYVHQIQCNSFAHRGLLHRDLRSGLIRPVVLWSLCATAARFVYLDNQEEATTKAAAFRKGAWTMIVEEMDTGKMANVSSLARFVYDDLLDGRFASAWFLLGLATRMARAMRIDADPNFSSMIWADQEARRRVMWSLFCLDSLLSDGSPNNTLFGHDDLINLQLPCTERNFLLQIPCQTEHLGDGMDGEVRETFGQGLREKGGLISHYVKIMNLRRAILR